MNNLIFIVVAKLIAAKMLKRQSEMRMVRAQKIKSWFHFLKRKQTNLRQFFHLRRCWIYVFKQKTWKVGKYPAVNKETFFLISWKAISSCRKMLIALFLIGTIGDLILAYTSQLDYYTRVFMTFYFVGLNLDWLNESF